MIKRIGIVSGVAFELDAFLPDKKGALQVMSGLGVRSVSHGGKDVLLACEGIGKVAAAMTASVLAIEGKVDILIVMGTAGKIGPRPEQLFKITDAFEADYGAHRESGFVHFSAGTLPIGRPRLYFHEAMPTPVLDLPGAVIATSDAFIESRTHAEYVHQTFGADLIDMETGAVAHVASRRGLPWCAIKATTDDANDESAANFHANLTTAARASAQAVEELINRL